MPCSIDEAEDGTERGIYRIDIPLDIPLDISTTNEISASEKENPDFFYMPKRVNVPEIRNMFRVRGTKRMFLNVWKK